MSLTATHSANLLPCLHILAIACHCGVVMGIGGDKILAMLNHDQVAIATQLVTDIHHLTLGVGVNGLTTYSSNINALVTAICTGVVLHHLPLVGQWQ